MMEPGQSDPRTPLTLPETDAVSNPASPTTIGSISSQSSEYKSPKDALWVENRLMRHNCFQNEEGALQKHPSFQKLVLKTINRKRHSTVHPDSPKKFQQVHQYYERCNKDTFLHNVLPRIIQPFRTVKSRVRADAVEIFEEAQYPTQDQEDQADQEVQEMHVEGPERHVCKNDTTGTPEQVAEQGEGSRPGSRLQEEPEYSVEYFFDDGLVVKTNGEFSESFLPTNEEDEELAKAMAKVDGMTNPKPDYTYGLRFDSYPIPDDVTVSAYIGFLLEVVPLLHHPFFIIEGSSDSGSKAEAENQACRGGAALVNAARQLLEKIDAPSTATGPDQQTFVYSATLSPGLMDIWVHWAEVHTMARPRFHMHRLESVSLFSAGAVGKLRRITHNILDWGCVDRAPQIQTVYNQIFAYERTNNEERREQLAEETST